MSAEKNWQFELEEYIKQGEPGQIEKSEACAKWMLMLQKRLTAPNVSDAESA